MEVGIEIIILIATIIIIIKMNYEEMKIWFLNRLIVKRGILAPDCFWYSVSDLLLKDGAGINLYNEMKEKYGDFPLTYQFNEPVYLVNNVNHIKIILDNSPNIFGVGKLKKKIFSSFMEKNVGVSQGCPWKHRRYINDKVLDTDKLHHHSEKYNEYLQTYMYQWRDKSVFDFSDFQQLGRFMTSKIVFGVKEIHNDVFNMFTEANTTNTILNQEDSIDPKIKNNYYKVLNHYIDNPTVNSMIEIFTNYSKNRDDIINQIPHLIFPMIGVFASIIPRILIFLLNHRNVLQKVVKEIHSIQNKKDINKLLYTRKCIMEALRLINPVITTFRTLLRDFSFEKHSFKKGTQFLILNNPVLREKEYFKHPDEFIPERWSPKMENSYYAISFNQGPQRCPGKELVIFLIQSFLYNFIQTKKINTETIIQTMNINKKNIQQTINPCEVKFIFK